jgi:hypothetical protein
MKSAEIGTNSARKWTQASVSALFVLIVSGLFVATVGTTSPTLGLETAATGRFSDDDGNVHEGYIEAIAAAGISRGCNPPANTHYGPSCPTSRSRTSVMAC